MSSREAFLKEYDHYVVTSYGKPFSDIVFVSGDGAYLTSMDGKKYLDFWAGITVTAIGHRNPEVQEAVRAQMAKLVHCAAQSYYTVPVLELAKEIIKIAPMQPCKATVHTSGTEANEVALKMIKRYTKRHEVISLQGSYHAWGYHSGIPGTPTSHYSHFAPALGPNVPGLHYAPAPYCYRCSLGLQYPGCNLQCAKMIEDIINFSTSRDVAGFMAETIQGVGGIVVPPDDYFKEVQKILGKYSIPFVLDEVQTRLGQTGDLWGAVTYDIQPDVITTAKAIANGWPLSLVLARNEIADSLETGDHYTTFGHHPVMCAASRATVKYILEHRLWENAKKIGGLLLKNLNTFADTCAIIGDVRGKGLMIGVEIVKDKMTKEPGPQETTEVRKLCADHGLIVGMGGWWNNVIRIQPPLIITPEHAHEALDIFELVVKQVAKETK